MKTPAGVRVIITSPRQKTVRLSKNRFQRIGMLVRAKARRRAKNKVQRASRRVNR